MSGGRSEWRRRRVVVVDDDHDTRSILGTALEAYGFEVHAAENGADGLEHVRRVAPDVVLMDLHMPVLDGIEAARELRADPVTRHIPIVAVTARVSPYEADSVREIGFDDVMSKPVDVVALIRVARKWSRSQTDFW